MCISKALAYGSALINQPALFIRQNQTLRPMLLYVILSVSAEYILVVADFYDISIRKSF